MEGLLRCNFCELTNEEMVSIFGGGSLKNLLCLTAGSILTANAPLIAILATPAAGVMAAGVGLELLGEGKLLTGGE